MEPKVKRQGRRWLIERRNIPSFIRVLLSLGVNGSERMKELYSVWLYRRYMLKARLYSSLLWQQLGLINNN